MTITQWGAFTFGVVVGWFTYFVNRHRQEEVSLADVATIIGALGGASVLALFPAKTVLFGAYGIGLGAGFFAYFIILVIIIISQSKNNWTFEWFLDGRKPVPKDGQVVSTDRPMIASPSAAAKIVKQ
jgi:hypothetical protein